jgi:DNA-binding beta-propeller fold protein YncE
MVAAAVAVIALLALAPGAFGDTLICGPGPAAGQCEEPQNIAVDTAAKRLYVADARNNRIDIFDAETGAFEKAFGWKVNKESPKEKLQVCTAVTGCQAGSKGAGAGQFGFPLGVAVDPASGDLYITELENHRVQKFNPASEFLLMVGGGVDKTNGGNLCTAASGHTCGIGAEGSGEGEFSSGPNRGIYAGVDPGGITYVVDNPPQGNKVEARLQKFEPSGAEIAPQRILFEAPEVGAQGVAVDPTGDFWVPAAGQVRKYDAAGRKVCSSDCARLLRKRFHLGTGWLSVSEQHLRVRLRGDAPAPLRLRLLQVLGGGPRPI